MKEGKMQETSTFAGVQLNSILERMAVLAAEQAAHGLSTMLGRPIRLTVPRLSLVPLCEVPYRVGGPETEAVGIYLQVQGDLPGHVMLILPYQDAFRLVDLLFEAQEGATMQLGPLERSALGEVGNVTASLFLNAIADATGLSLRPSPPAVVMDMVGAIIDIIVIASGAVADEILLLEVEFHGPDRTLEIYFWMVPAQSIADADIH
jgi:chemotaxis protein CheC